MVRGWLSPPPFLPYFFGSNLMETTLKDITLRREIEEILSPHFREGFIDTVFKHMKGNDEDDYDHKYLRDSLKVAEALIHNEATQFTEHDKSVVYAIVALFETGHPLTSLYPYDASPGVAWMFLRLYAHSSFSKEELRFITQSCKPLNPQSLRPSSRTRLQLVVHNTKRLTDVVSQNYQKIYDEFLERHYRGTSLAEVQKLFMDYYGPTGNLWETISDSAKGVFASEISLFKRKVKSVIGNH